VLAQALAGGLQASPPRLRPYLLCIDLTLRLAGAGLATRVINSASIH
jgi:hypothetical protein